MKYILLSTLLFLLSTSTRAQGCCSGGSASPIAGGVSQGVLRPGQMELGMNYQYTNSDRFKVLDHDTASLFDNLSSNYLYNRVAYGISDKLTFSLEAGYFLNKTQIGLNNSDTIHSSGIGDLILFPKYQVYKHSSERFRTEVVLGIGYKLPLGKYNDSNLVFTNPFNGQEFYSISPPTIQPSTGANDLILYGFFLNEFTKPAIKTFANVLYIRKGWNPMGQKFGDYASISLYAGKTFRNRYNVMLQLKGEHVAMMDYDKNIDMLALYNIDVESTGTRKVFLVPQFSYSWKSLTGFILYELPLYQFAHGTQVVSQHTVTAGISYRFILNKKACGPELIPGPLSSL